MFQFRLLAILLLCVVLCSSLAIFGLAGLFIFGFILLAASAIARSWWAFLLVLGFMVMVAFLLPAGSCARETVRQNCCQNGMKQLGLALHNYSRDYGCFPPAYVADKDGRPMHSWRVLILPYMENRTLYKEYNFSEPWDGPNNKKILASRPCWGYTCISDQNANDSSSTCTSYAAVVGPGTAWPGSTSKKPAELAPADQTIMLVEVTDADIPWTAPRDVDLSRASAMISSKHFPDTEFFFHTTRAGVNVAMADGSVHHMPGGALESDVLPDLLKIGGYQQDVVDRKWGMGGRRIDWSNCIVFAVWLLSTGGLLWLAVRSRKTSIAAVAENEQGRAGESPTNVKREQKE